MEKELNKLKLTQVKQEKVLYDISVMLTAISEKLINKINNIRFEKKIAIKKVNQSVVILVLTVMFFT